MLTYAGASSDLSRVFFAANDALTEETPFAPEALDGGQEKFNLYEWHEGELSLVNVMPGNATTEPGAAFGAGSAHSISADGSQGFTFGFLTSFAALVMHSGHAHFHGHSHGVGFKGLAHSHGGFSKLNLTTLSAFLTWFGGVGYLLTEEK